MFDLALEDPEGSLQEIDKYRAEQSLLYFFERAWREIDPARLKINWHHEAIAVHLEAVARGEIRRIVLNVPPRSSKTILVNVCYGAWLWIQERDPDFPLMGAQVKLMCISYGQRLSTEIATLARRLILSPWYQGHWGERVRILDDQGRIDNFGTTAGGFRIATLMTGSTLGRGGDIRIIDDPQSVEDANSEVETENVVRTYREALQTRETDPSTSAEIIIMQRLGDDDLTGYVLKQAEEAETARKLRGDPEIEDDPNEFVHVMYPMLHDPMRHCITQWYDDPRTEQDELLWPDQFPRAVVDSRQTQMGPFAFAGQMQQKPVPRGGGIFQEDWFEAWPPLGPDGRLLAGFLKDGRIQYPAFEYVVAWVDTAFTINEENDPCAMIVLGVFRDEGKGRIDKRADGTYVRVADDHGFPKVMVVYGWEKHLTIHGPPQQIPEGVDERDWNGPRYLKERQKSWGLVEWVTDTCTRYKVDHLGIETQAAGHTLEQELFRLHNDKPWAVQVDVIPAQGTKVARAYAVQGIVSSHQVYAPMFVDGTRPSWCTPIMDQIRVFPKTRYKDLTDTFTACLKHLRDIGVMDRREEWTKAEEQAAAWPTNRPTSLPYDLIILAALIPTFFGWLFA